MNREQAINYLKSSGFSNGQIEDVVNALQKKGKWEVLQPVDKYNYILLMCSECGTVYDISKHSKYDFCPNCGAKMQEGEKMKKRSFDEMIAYFKRRVSEMDIDQDYKMELLGMVTAIGYKHEQTAQQWIPCSERLPYAECGESDAVLCCTESGVQMVLYYNGGVWCYPTGETYVCVNHKNGWHNKVIAWMPLPEPWRGGQYGTT